jgi:hypothetical protein
MRAQVQLGKRAQCDRSRNLRHLSHFSLNLLCLQACSDNHVYTISIWWWSVAHLCLLLGQVIPKSCWAAQVPWKFADLQLSIQSLLRPSIKSKLFLQRRLVVCGWWLSCLKIPKLCAEIHLSGLPKAPNSLITCQWHCKDWWICWIIWAKRQSGCTAAWTCGRGSVMLGSTKTSSFSNHSVDGLE